jgi:HK97 family phage portal protein
VSVADLLPGAWWAQIGLTPEQGRAFATPGAVPVGADRYGAPSQDFTPPEYGSYLAASNGVYVCSSLRSRLLSSLPLRHYRLTGEGERTEVTRGRLWELTRKVNPYWTFGRLIQMTELSLCAWGSAFWFVVRPNRVAPPLELWWAKPDRVTVVPSKTNFVSHFEYDQGDGTKQRFDIWETVWFRYPNPLDQWSGLSPLAAARLAADVSSAGMKAARNLYSQGITAGGIITPSDNRSPFTKDQAVELQEQINRRLKGVDNAHRWAILHFDAKWTPFQMSPKDAESIAQLRWDLEEIARAYGVPLDLIGGQRTYENVQAAERAVWNHTIVPEARFFSEELTEQLLPMFVGTDGADLCEFDFSNVESMHEAKSERWTREQGQLNAFVITVNEWRNEQGLDPVPWGDAAWGTLQSAPIVGPEAPTPSPDSIWTKQEPEPVEASPGDEPAAEPPERSATPHHRAYNDEAHQRQWDVLIRRTDPLERTIVRTVQGLFRDQEKSILSQLEQRSARSAEGVALEPFDRARWIKRFRIAIRPDLRSIVDAAGTAAMEDLALGLTFDLFDPNVARFLEGRAQRFAVEVNETTWLRLKESLSAGLQDGESIDQLAERVRHVMGVRRGSDAELIARTETTGAYNGGTLESWRQSGVVTGKRWLAALDARTRETHVAAHDQTVGLDDNFSVGGATGPGPGLMGEASEDCNCRCSLAPLVDVEAG